VPGYEAANWQGIGVPKNTSAAIANRLNLEITAGLADASLPNWAQRPLRGSRLIPKTHDGRY
jgi:hypothetical protein